LIPELFGKTGSAASQPNEHPLLLQTYFHHCALPGGLISVDSRPHSTSDESEFE